MQVSFITSTILPVTNNRVTFRGKMYSDLVFPTGRYRDINQCLILTPSDRYDERVRWFSLYGRLNIKFSIQITMDNRLVALAD